MAAVVMSLKQMAALLPARWQGELRRIYYRRQILKGTFASPEPEHGMLERIVVPGDWVLDIGANVGHYTTRLSELVGPAGRVIAVEPVPATFSLLASNAELLPNRNVTLLNVAASDRTDVVSLSVPTSADGRRNYYRAHLSNARHPDARALAVPVDTLVARQRIALAKIDAEGHELPVLRGMRKVIERHRPALIIETDSSEVVAYLQNWNYEPSRQPGSPNCVFSPGEAGANAPAPPG